MAETEKPSDLPKEEAEAPPSPPSPLSPPPPPSPGLAARFALRVLQAGAIASVLAVVTYKVFELDRFFIPKEFVLHLTACVAGLSALGAVRRVTPTRVDVLLAAFLGVSALSALFATNGWVAGRALAVSVSGVAVFWTARGLKQAGLARPLLAGLAAGVAVAAGTALLQAYGVTTDFFSINRSPGGTLGNRNFIGHLAAIGLPLLLVVALRAGRAQTYLLASAALGLVAATLVLTRSRAAWLGVALGFAVVFVGVVFTPSVRRDWKLMRRFVLLLAFVAAGVFGALTLPNALRWTSDDPYLETARGVVNFREGSGRGRLIQYGTTAKMAAYHPLLGVGPGNWPVAYADHAGRRDPSMDPREAGMTMNPWPSSDWVALLAERGIAAFALFVLAGFWIAVGAWRRMRTAEDPGDGFTAVALLATLAGTVVVGAFDAVTLLAWPTLFFWAAAGALWPADAMREVPRAGPWVRSAALLVLALLAGAGALRSAGQVRAMALYAADESLESLEQAARLDPGNYRVHLRLAQRHRRNREKRCTHAVAAHALFPTATAAERLARRCD